ncbi:MAG TPA: DNA recombination protein RmuC [Bryobacteraceae bacterium]|jgi:DNA recombination protein RmuC|nr:DNA recombination protein RmuC [Bryobacteraceae bacterium]
MNLVLGILAIMLLSAVAFAAYQWAEANRWRQTSSEAQRQCEVQRRELEEARVASVRQQAEIAKSGEVAAVQLQLLTRTQQQLDEKFRSLASDALQNNSQLFLDRSREQLAHLVQPVNQTLQRFEEQMQAIERTRAGAYSSITSQVQALTELQERVRLSTEQLKTALRSPSQRGRWGEIQLRRVVELAGMVEYCDFDEQKTLFGETAQRPDLVVKLPNQCRIVVDAKVSLDAYLRAAEAERDDDRAKLLKEHARQVRTHVKSLGEKAYWQQLDASPEFVVAFLPLESLFSAALEHDPELLDFGVRQRVMIATPTSLISLLLVVAHGWRRQALAENVEKIRDTGLELYRRVLTMSEHFAKLGDAIERTSEAYNATVGSLEKNVLTAARKLRELGPASAPELEEPSPVENVRRKMDSAKWGVAS